MKATEVRIGNYVYDTKGEINKINLAAIEYLLREGSSGACQVKPIPLTEDKLKKCGFEKLEFGNGFMFAISLGGGRVFLLKYNPLRTDCFYEHYYGTKVQYLHQLQNLYFVLTGEELTITL